jgi:hypothetical protein
MVRATASHLFKQVTPPWVICEWRVRIGQFRRRTVSVL